MPWIYKLIINKNLLKHAYIHDCMLRKMNYCSNCEILLEFTKISSENIIFFRIINRGIGWLRFILCSLSKKLRLIGEKEYITKLRLPTKLIQLSKCVQLVFSN